ncbi:Pho80p cyclin [Tilletia horrida]|nr:Pho80p cyclin [Tilletia horrida]
MVHAAAASSSPASSQRSRSRSQSARRADTMDVDSAPQTGSGSSRSGNTSLATTTSASNSAKLSASTSASASESLARQSPGSGINNAEIAPTALPERGISTNVQVLPALFEDSKAEDVVVLVADMLSRLVAHNDKLPLHPSSLTRFHSRATPGISVASYLRRIVRYTNLEKVCTLILLVYIDRVCERMPGFTICGLTVHRFVCAAIVCASKALCDAFSTNSHYAKVGGISLIELNMLEKEFLENIDWTLSHYYSSLVRSHPAYVLAEEAPSSPSAEATPSQGAQDSPQLAPVPGYDDPSFLSARLRDSEYSDLNVPVPGHRWPRPDDRKAQQRGD